LLNFRLFLAPLLLVHLLNLLFHDTDGRKWFATVEIERMSCDPDWFDTAGRRVAVTLRQFAGHPARARLSLGITTSGALNPGLCRSSAFAKQASHCL
jgi:hypothetical protein